MSPVELEKELRDLKERVERLEQMVAHALQGQRPQSQPPAVEAFIEDLRQKGLLITSPPTILASALRWRSLPPEIQEMIRQEADHLPPGPTASELILQDRR